MKRVTVFLIGTFLVAALCACGAARAAVSVSDPTPPASAAAAATPAPAETAVPDRPLPEAPPDGWAESYLDFIDDNYDIFAALWPEGLAGVGFIDLDLDGMPEMVVFDLGASATLGVQMFDSVDGEVYCVSSVNESAAGAFGDEHFSKISVCTSYFESFRLSRTEAGYCFWVDSANGTIESSWDEIIRFDCDEGVLMPVSICARYLESDEDTGVVVTERYTVDEDDADAAAYEAAADVYMGAEDLGYDAAGMFLWNDMSDYDASYDGLMAMARDAAEAYVPIASS